MGLIDEVIKSPRPMPPKGIVYGAPGIGKTTLIGSCDSALIIDCEHGANNVDCSRTPYLSRWLEMQKWLTEIETGTHDYSVIGIDSVDWMLRRIEERVSGAGDGTAMSSTLAKSHGGYGNGAQVLRNYVYCQLLPTLDRIVQRGIAVIMLAHASRETITDVDGVSAEKSSPDLPKGLSSPLIEWADFVAVARKNRDGSRVLQFEETPAAIAKNRYGITGSVEMTWKSFSAAIAGGIKKNLTKEDNKNG